MHGCRTLMVRGFPSIKHSTTTEPATPLAGVPREHGKRVLRGSGRVHSDTPHDSRQWTQPERPRAADTRHTAPLHPERCSPTKVTEARVHAMTPTNPGIVAVRAGTGRERPRPAGKWAQRRPLCGDRGRWWGHGTVSVPRTSAGGSKCRFLLCAQNPPGFPQFFGGKLFPLPAAPCASRLVPCRPPSSPHCTLGCALCFPDLCRVRSLYASKWRPFPK